MFSCLQKDSDTNCMGFYKISPDPCYMKWQPNFISTIIPIPSGDKQDEVDRRSKFLEEIRMRKNLDQVLSKDTVLERKSSEDTLFQVRSTPGCFLAHYYALHKKMSNSGLKNCHFLMTASALTVLHRCESACARNTKEIVVQKIRDTICIGKIPRRWPLNTKGMQFRRLVISQDQYAKNETEDVPQRIFNDEFYHLKRTSFNSEKSRTGRMKTNVAFATAAYAVDDDERNVEIHSGLVDKYLFPPGQGKKEDCIDTLLRMWAGHKEKLVTCETVTPVSNVEKVIGVNEITYEQLMMDNKISVQDLEDAKTRIAIALDTVSALFDLKLKREGENGPSSWAYKMVWKAGGDPVFLPINTKEESRPKPLWHGKEAEFLCADFAKRGIKS